MAICHNMQWNSQLLSHFAGLVWGAAVEPLVPSPYLHSYNLVGTQNIEKKINKYFNYVRAYRQVVIRYECSQRRMECRMDYEQPNTKKEALLIIIPVVIIRCKPYDFVLNIIIVKNQFPIQLISYYSYRNDLSPRSNDDGDCEIRTTISSNDSFDKKRSYRYCLFEFQMIPVYVYVKYSNWMRNPEFRYVMIRLKRYLRRTFAPERWKHVFHHTWTDFTSVFSIKIIDLKMTRNE